KVSHEVAEALALGEYEKYRRKQDKEYISDFDREVKKISKMIRPRPQISSIKYGRGTRVRNHK
ncbi:MAG: hypothetical protein Q7S52_01315, partial [bacterium]|nr:hypothetical protein [bacterium]